MAKNLSTLLSALLTKAGVDVTDSQFAPMLNVTGGITDEAYEEVENRINALLTVEQAKNSTEVVRHIKANVLDPVDTYLKKKLDALNLTDEERAAILADKSTYSKIDKVLSKTQEIAALEAKKEGGTATHATQKRIDELSAEIVAIKAASQQSIANLQAQAANDFSEYALRAMLAAKQYGTGVADQDINVDLAKGLIDKAMKKEGLVRTFNRDTNSWDLLTADGLKYQSNHKEVKFSDFVDGTLATAKVLQQSSGQAPAGASGVTSATIPAGGQKPLSRGQQMAIEANRQAAAAILQ